MFRSVFSAAVCGIEGIMIRVEADISDGLPMFGMVGYLSSQVREAEERVRVALKNSGYRLPPKLITINLSPADIKKEGTAYDLPIAVAVLCSMGYIPPESLEETVFLGELGLNGRLQHVHGVLPAVCGAAAAGMKRCILPEGNVREASVIGQIEAIGAVSLEAVVDFLNGRLVLDYKKSDAEELLRKSRRFQAEDLSEVAGQRIAKRALEIAAAGGHNLLLVGAAGSGKTMLAKRLPDILPELTLKECIEVSKVYSVAGLLDEEHILMTERPFRAPHHTITKAAMAGGGKNPKPGEISLATNGVLFLDEFPEFERECVELLREPLEESKITVNRTGASVDFPCNIMLVAAMNPCLCGFYPDRSLCRCSENQIRRYLSGISRPLLDRFDLFASVEPLSYQELTKTADEETTEEVRKRVKRARARQEERYQGESFQTNARVPASRLNTYCSVSKEDGELLKTAFEQLHLSSRGYHRLLRTARTIADLEEKASIEESHLREAVCYQGGRNFLE